MLTLVKPDFFNRAQVFRLGPGLNFEKLSGFNQIGRRSKKSDISVSDRVFEIAGIKQKPHSVALSVYLRFGSKYNFHMELAEWLVHWAPKLASRVRCSTKSSP